MQLINDTKILKIEEVEAGIVFREPNGNLAICCSKTDGLMKCAELFKNDKPELLTINSWDVHALTTYPDAVFEVCSVGPVLNGDQIVDSAFSLSEEGVAMTVMNHAEGNRYFTVLLSDPTKSARRHRQAEISSYKIWASPAAMQNGAARPIFEYPAED